MNNDVDENVAATLHYRVSSLWTVLETTEKGEKRGELKNDDRP